MPKSEQHWGYDLAVALFIALIVGMVFWLVPQHAF
jgi:hypothetical protein